MKKKFNILISLCFVCLLSSCRMFKNTGTPYGESEVPIEWRVGSTEEVPYESILDKEMFQFSFENYTDSENPLQLEGGTFEDAVVVKPFKSVLVDETGIVAPLNVWQFPVVHDDEYIGFINCDLRFGSPQFYGSAGIADNLNDALKKGSIAVFDTNKGTYGMYEDNTTVNITDGILITERTPYDGTLTFEDINQGYNLITSDSVKDIIYPATE